jgi:hypothetical protein
LLLRLREASGIEYWGELARELAAIGRVEALVLGDGDDQAIEAIGAELGELGSRADGGEGLVGDLPAEAEWAFDGDAEEAERFVGEDLDPVALLEAAVQAGDLGDLLGLISLRFSPRLLRTLIHSSRTSTSWTLPRRAGLLRLVTIQK